MFNLLLTKCYNKENYQHLRLMVLLKDVQEIDYLLFLNHVLLMDLLKVLYKMLDPLLMAYHLTLSWDKLQNSELNTIHSLSMILYSIKIKHLTKISFLIFELFYITEWNYLKTIIIIYKFTYKNLLRFHLFMRFIFFTKNYSISLLSLHFAYYTLYCFITFQITYLVFF